MAAVDALCQAYARTKPAIAARGQGIRRQDARLALGFDAIDAATAQIESLQCAPHAYVFAMHTNRATQMDLDLDLYLDLDLDLDYGVLGPP